ILAAYKDIAAPWKELLRWYQQKEDIKIKFEQIVSRFHSDRMVDEQSQMTRSQPSDKFSGDWKLNAVSYHDDENDSEVFKNISLTIESHKNGFIHFPLSTGRSELAFMLSGIIQPTTGKVLIGESDFSHISEPVLADHIAFVDDGGILNKASLKENLLYGFYRYPLVDQVIEESDHEFIEEALASGNLPDKFDGAWGKDGEATDLPSDSEILEIVRKCDFEKEIFKLGLRGKSVELDDHFMKKLLLARGKAIDLMRFDDESDMIVHFDIEQYNAEANVGENLLFGACTDSDLLDMDKLASNPFIYQLLERYDLFNDILDAGIRTVEIMIELFSEVKKPNPGFQNFNIIHPHEFDHYKKISESQRNQSELSEDDKISFINVAMRLIPARHRLGIVDKNLQAKILSKRKVFHESVSKHFESHFFGFELDKINPAISIQDNILFGKLVTARPEADHLIQKHLSVLLEEIDLKKDILKAGLTFEAGPKGQLINDNLCQKILLGRALLKNADYMVMRDPLNGLASDKRESIIDAVLKHRKDKATLILASENYSQKIKFDYHWQLNESADQLILVE
ncbi:MAG: hypothetical protein AAF403_04895, partial [Pseudomonadota bacterium]